MISFPPLLVFIPFGIYLFVHVFLGLVNVKHIFRTGSATFTSFLLTSFFLLYSLIIISIVWGLTGEILLKPSITLDFSNLFNSFNSIGGI